MSGKAATKVRGADANNIDATDNQPTVFRGSIGIVFGS